MQEKIEKLRKLIDEFDLQISDLILKRLDIVAQIGLGKSRLKLPFRDKKREEQKINSLLEKYPNSHYKNELISLFKDIFGLSLGVQKPKKMALLGVNLKGSLSPKVHNLISQKLDFKYDFVVLDKIRPEAKKVKLALINGDFDAFFITMPYKREFIGLCDYLTMGAAKTGVINLIYYKDGHIFGANTDILGFSFDFQKGKFKDLKEAYILGNGATAKSVNFALSELGIASKIVDLKKDTNVLSYSDLEKIKPVLVINTTPVGINENDKPLLTKEALSNCKYFYDCLYHHKKTSYIKLVKHDNFSNGLGMLIYQAICGVEEVYKLEFNKEEIFGQVLREMEEEK